MEKIVRNQLEGEIQLPEKLDFECNDRSLVIDQLKILQMVLKKQKNNSENTSSVNQLSSQSCSTNSTSSTEGSSLIDKVERHKQAMAQLRENKLKEMDEQSEALFKASNSNKDLTKIRTMKDELNKLKIAEEDQGGPSQEKKRNNTGFNDNGRENKKSKLVHNKNNEEVGECTQSTNESTKGKSLIDIFHSCSSMKSRNEVREKAIEMMKRQGYKVSVVEPGGFALKYALSAPYHIFFSRIQNSKATYDQPFSITFPEILDRSLGEIVCSLHINFMVDVGWLCLQYLLAGQRTDMSILYGDRVDEEKLSLNITMIPVTMPTKFGCHHTKIMILKYKDDGIRVVVSTANLYSDDWENRTQGSVK